MLLCKGKYNDHMRKLMRNVDHELFYFQVISQLKILMRSDVIAHKFDREKWSNELSPFLNLWKKLNQVCVFLMCLLVDDVPISVVYNV